MVEGGFCVYCVDSCGLMLMQGCTAIIVLTTKLLFDNNFLYFIADIDFAWAASSSSYCHPG